MEGKRPLKEEDDSLSISESGPVAVPLDEPSAKRLRTSEPSSSVPEVEEVASTGSESILRGAYGVPMAKQARKGRIL